MSNKERAQSRSVMIATPTRGNPCWLYAHAFAETCVMLDRLGIKYGARFIVGSSNVPRTRNELVARFLASGFSDLIFIDDDMGWHANSVLRLLASDKDVIGWVFRKRIDKPNTDPDAWCVHFGEFDDRKHEQDETGAMRVERVGTGFLKITRNVFEIMMAAHPEWKRDGIAEMDERMRSFYHQFFRFDSDNTEMSEDFVFCDRWRALGGDVWIDSDIAMTHVGAKAYHGAISELIRPIGP